MTMAKKWNYTDPPLLIPEACSFSPGQVDKVLFLIANDNIFLFRVLSSL